jgi:hypothetical protein
MSAEGLHPLHPAAPFLSDSDLDGEYAAHYADFCEGADILIVSCSGCFTCLFGFVWGDIVLCVGLFCMVLSISRLLGALSTRDMPISGGHLRLPACFVLDVALKLTVQYCCRYTFLWR